MILRRLIYTTFTLFLAALLGFALQQSSIMKTYTVIPTVYSVNEVTSATPLTPATATFVPTVVFDLPLSPTVAISPTSSSPTTTIIGNSFNGTPIEARSYGAGQNLVLIIGPVHGGYEVNGYTLALKLEEYVKTNPTVIPSNVRVAFVPNPNPDGVNAGTNFQARFNGNGVDLNRNFDSAWAPTAVVGNTPVNPGQSAFSEPETRALRDFILAQKPAITVWYHCCWGSGVTFVNEPGKVPGEGYRQAAGYQYLTGASYPVTGDAIDWMGIQRLAGFEVELPEWTNRSDPDLDHNLPAFQSLINWAAGQVSTITTNWQIVDQATGATLYRSGNNFLAEANLTAGAQIFLTGSNTPMSIEDHWNELGSNAFFASNGCLFEPGGVCSFPYWKGGTQYSSGPQTGNPDYTNNLRALVLNGNNVQVVTYTDTTPPTANMLVGFDTDIGKLVNERTLVGVSSDGTTIYILQFVGDTQAGVNLLTPLNIAEDHIVLFDGGGSTQGKYRTGYTYTTNRPIPNGICIVVP